jgi:histidyl-tRNA synthetase
VDWQPPRGTQDLFPPVSERMRELYDAAARQAGLFGFRYLETATLEPTELFVRTSGETSDVVRKEKYTFEDRSGRSLTLRPEATAPVMRAFLAHQAELPSPFKGWTLELEWRYGRPQAGRLREFRIFDVEVLGAAGAGADVEVMALADGFLRGRGLSRFELQVNSIGDAACRPAYRERLISYLEANAERLTDEHRDGFRDNPLRVLDCKDPACRTVSKDAPKLVDELCDPCREHFDAVQSGLREEGVAFRLEPTLVRGLDYYTRTAFEFVSGALHDAQATLCGGGRYDGLAEVLGGPPTPGVGFGMGLDRVLLAIDGEGVEVATEPPLDAFVVAMGDAGRAWASQVTRDLRAAGVRTAAAFEVRPLKAQLRMADRAEARYAVIIGEREAEARSMVAKHLADGHQMTMTIEELVAAIRGHDGGGA